MDLCPLQKSFGSTNFLKLCLFYFPPSMDSDDEISPHVPPPSFVNLTHHMTNARNIEITLNSKGP